MDSLMKRVVSCKFMPIIFNYNTTAPGFRADSEN